MDVATVVHISHPLKMPQDADVSSLCRHHLQIFNHHLQLMLANEKKRRLCMDVASVVHISHLLKMPQDADVSSLCQHHLQIFNHHLQLMLANEKNPGRGRTIKPNC